MKSPIFLSASVPTREPFSSNCDVFAIREAILALITISAREREIVFGGHPAVSPLVEYAARSIGAVDNIYIYQSKWFETLIPEVAFSFKNFKWTEIPDETATLHGSLTKMRREMIQSRSYGCAVIIGGMEGIFEEVSLFKNIHPGKPIFSFSSTGGASAQVFEEEKNTYQEGSRHLMVSETRYRRVFRDLIPND